MPAKPRPPLDPRRLRLVDDLPERVRAVREVLARAVVVRDLVDRVLLELGRTEDFFGRERWDLVSPFSRRILLTVRAATSSARRPYRPDLLALCLMCLYCRSRFGLAPRGMDFLPSRSRYHLHGSRNYL